ncbi:MAG: nucleotidyltransferase substrate binding protein [Candidatus Margulisbacteria bacterium]|nr:nucleotidyltransferase substrate binding protein [Candidatus Margulisiibacteriota bacterium]
MKLDTSSLKRVIELFKRGHTRYLENTSDLEVRDACIQRFEYTYELANKMLKRQLEQDVANSSQVDLMSFKERIRLGAEKGYIQDPLDWFEFRNRRNITSHTYDDIKANAVVEIFEPFLKEVTFLLNKIDIRNED